jgi:hypothetical protein
MAQTPIVSLTPSIYCCVRVSAILMVGFAEVFWRFLDPLANGLWTACPVCVVIRVPPYSVGKLIEWKLFSSLCCIEGNVLHSSFSLLCRETN